MEAEEAENLKWEGKATVKLRKPTAEEVWPLLQDFCTLHKWLPTIDTCFKVDGVDGECGLVRHCASAIPSPLGEGGAAVKWCRERLTGIDPAEKWLRYEMVENNIGFKWYESTLKVAAIDGGGCEIEWSFAADPVGGRSYDEFAAYVGCSLRGMAENMERALELESEESKLDS